MESGPLSAHERALHKLLNKKLLGPAPTQDDLGAPLIQVALSEGGGANTRFFHLHANNMKCKNFVGKLKMDGPIYVDHEDMARVVDE